MKQTFPWLVFLMGFAAMTGAQAGETVVLLHGMSRSPASMARMEDRLEAAGYVTCNIGYPSTKHTIETLAEDYVLPRVKECMRKNPGPVNFVTHSLGGIVVRELRKVAPKIPFGRVVMLGPPNQGSEVADTTQSWALYRWINGPAGQQIGTARDSLPNTLGPADFQVGVIAGDRQFLEPFGSYIPGASDGKVSTERAKLEGMQDYIVLPVSHALMMRDDTVIEQTIEFLRTGEFSRSLPAAEPHNDPDAARH